MGARGEAAVAQLAQRADGTDVRFEAGDLALGGIGERHGSVFSGRAATRHNGTDARCLAVEPLLLGLRESCFESRRGEIKKGSQFQRQKSLRGIDQADGYRYGLELAEYNMA